MLQDELDVTIETIDVNIVVENVGAIDVDQNPDVIFILAGNVGPQGPPGEVTLPADTHVPATTRIFQNFTGVGDTQPAYRLFGDGKTEWGPGGAVAPDVNLYRPAAGQLKTDAGFFANGDVFAQANSAWVRIGNAGPAGQSGLYIQGDTKLYRSGAAVLATDGRFNVLQSAQTVNALYGAATHATYTGNILELGAVRGDSTAYNFIQLANSAGYKFAIRGDSALVWSGDTTLYRQASSQLRTNGLLVSSGFNSYGAIGVYLPSPGTAFFSMVGAEAQYRWLMDSNGAMYWGSGAVGADTNLYRSSAGVLKTDGTFQVGSGGSETLTVHSGANAISLGRWGPASEPGIRLGGDTTMWRTVWQGYQTVQVDWMLTARSDIAAQIGAATQQVAIGAMGVGGRAGIFFGNPADIWMYRQISIAALAVSGRFRIDDPVLYFGVANDTTLYRAAATALQTDGSFQALKGIYSKSTGVGTAVFAAAETSDSVYAFQIGNRGGMSWGTGAASVDTNLYRSGINQLTTDGTFQAGGGQTEMSSNNIRIMNSAKSQNRLMLHRDFTGSDQPAIVLYGNTGTEVIRMGVAVGVSTQPAIRFAAVGGSHDVEIRRQTVGQIVISSMGSSDNTSQTNALLNVRRQGNDIEFGHGNAAGYGSTIGALSGGGAPFVMFCGEEGSTQNTVRTRGIYATILSNFTTGHLSVQSAASPNADNQSVISAPVDASAFNVVSDRAMKLDISDLSDKRLEWHDKLMKAKPYSFRRHPTDSLHVGLMADELPEETVTVATDDFDQGIGDIHMVDIYKLCTALLGSMQLLNDRVAALEAK